MMIDAYGLL